MTERSRGPARPSPSPDPDPSPTELSWREDDPILARWRANTCSHEEWLAALDAERPDVIDALVDARVRGDAALVRELGARLVWGWVSACRAGGAEKDGVLLSFDDEILDIDNDDDGLLRYLEHSVSGRRMNALNNRGQWTERERALAHAMAAEHYFEDTSEPYRCFQIVRVESRDGTPIFVAHIMEGCDYPCDSYFAGAADSIDAAMEAVKALGYVSADDVRERYPETRATGAAAVSFEMIEKEAVAMLEEEKRVRAFRSAPSGVEAPGIIGDPSRFTKPRGLGAGWIRFKMRNYYAEVAYRCRAAGDEAGYARFMARAEAAETKSLSEGPPVAISDRRPSPPASPDQASPD